MGPLEHPLEQCPGSPPEQQHELPEARPLADEHALAAVCEALGGRRVAGWSAGEEQLVGSGRALDSARLEDIRAALRAGRDPLGEAFCALRAPALRRRDGATYTPPAIIAAMLDWARVAFASGNPGAFAAGPARIVDPGTGSGRFLCAAGRAFPQAHLLGVELDPLAALMARANLAAAGLAARATVRVGDYRAIALDRAGEGATLFLGNPPYVRHHDIAPRWKRWFSDTAASAGLPASQRAGLHLHFLLATLRHARPGDAGIFVTSAEWLDVDYGRLARALLCGPLGGQRVDILEPTASAFRDAQSTATIVGFRVGARSASVRLRRARSLAELAPLRGGQPVCRELLARSPRWSPLSRPPPPPALPASLADADKLVELGELCRVHRGQVTGANRVWIEDPDSPPVPEEFLFPAVTRARELFAAGAALTQAHPLRRVIDLPRDLSALPAQQREAVTAFLAWARARGAHESYVARHRRPWWSVKLREPPPILATYMARRPPAFVRNHARARYLNIAHGLYPREPLPAASLDALSVYLSRSVDLGDGRTYAGGLTKFEPREMERLLVPTPQALAARAAHSDAA
ncbi:class I SAM-dependent methyltransferase [Haliangium ochraceum]|uniref:Site-specific DNA-methyltransferase (Adenine-specific) n=1 Tax=Haliangium ochraceum (strain DSM 14365 / JCM 11303 / SMP-2) TaxID=502025 RepID=D0LK66_HALO1|nr:class I SAM-dependent methyltransferase [Haliangium ochraceum]ACY13100.1 Site-specific DNA-methyltransferase (adenine- specific) [Haliangium ochraceum DSM 14365]